MMRIPEEARTTAATLSEAASRFLDYVETNPDCARPMDQRSANLPSWMEDYVYPLQAWPTFVGGQKLQEIRRATVEITRLVGSVLERIFGNDPRKIGSFYGIENEQFIALLLQPPNGIEEGLARVDFIDGPDGFKCLEVNMGAYIGGWQLRFWEEMYRTSPVLARFFKEQGITPWYEDPFRALFKHLAGETLRKGISEDGRFNTILVVVPGDLPTALSAVPSLNQIYSSVLAEKGLEGNLLVCAYPDSFSGRGGELYYRGTERIHAVVEYTDALTPTWVYRCFKAETTALYSPLARILGDKRNLALLSEYQESDLFDQGERDFLQRHLPWSRILRPGKVLYQGETIDLEALLLGRREDFVIKDGAGARGEGVLVGRMTPADQWETGIRSMLGTGKWLVQEHVSSRPYLYQRGEGFLLHDVVWGLFCFGGSYGGGFLRVMPSGQGSGIINSARGASEGLIFEV